MADKSKKLSPPYATFGSFTSFINKLREAGIPNRIDPSVFGNASGSVSYSVIAAMKFLKLIEEDGKVTPRGQALIDAQDDDRKKIMAGTLAEAYPGLFGGDIDLRKATSAEFDEHMREEFDVQGSTVDKIAAFFIAAANQAGVELSAHLKARKAVSASSSSKKSARQRKREPDDDNGGGTPAKALQDPPMTEKALEYRLVDLMRQAAGDAEVMTAIIKVVTWLQTREAEG